MKTDFTVCNRQLREHFSSAFWTNVRDQITANVETLSWREVGRPAWTQTQLHLVRLMAIESNVTVKT